MRLGVCLCIILQATFSVRTEMVVLPVTVTDAHGQTVGGLTVDDFRVFDNGRVKPIALFRGGDVPVTVGLIVDHSQSMRGKLEAVNAAISAFAGSGRTDDELFVVGFNDQARMTPLPGGKLFTSDAGELAVALGEGRPEGRTALYDAVVMGLRHLPSGKAQRKALIVVTDGGDNASRADYGEVRELARQSQAVIYGIGLTGAVHQEENPDILKRLCRDSGGTSHFPPATADIAGVVTAVSRDLRAQYTIGFAPAPPGPKPEYRNIKVIVARPEGATRHVRTRAGYTVQAVR
jgi:Ca-activated chloride channel family protein